MFYVEIIAFLASIAILVRCIQVASHIGLKEFHGHIFRFLLVAIGYVFTGTGGIACIIGPPHMRYFLVIGICMIMFADRRMGIKPATFGGRRKVIG